MGWYKEVEKPHNDPNVIVLERAYHKNGTHGEMKFPDGTMFDTLENPWLDNQQRISCIPEGFYTMTMRNSPVVSRTSGGEFKRGWEVTDVEGRTYIMVHPGNYTRNTAGCILVGMSKAFQGNEPVIWNSRVAFRKFMKKMEEFDEWMLVIKDGSNG